MEASTLWLIIGFIGQGLFAGRFIWQWLASEKAKKSVIPLPFWYLSISGGVILFFYALYKEDPVFICGQAMGLIVYVRNLYLIRNERRQQL
ncbi:MAG: lipid-A-disaccharide synthase N-terminal domain-containing protein [Alphaproteobacteria bacterium]|nr:lipid-A-disaccharide synthase N-terminal domain-containing protein [Alphaproteobacteria bacterium]